LLTLFLIVFGVGLVIGFIAGHRIHPIYNARMRAAEGVLSIGRRNRKV
jgi:hypothetical protein